MERLAMRSMSLYYISLLIIVKRQHSCLYFGAQFFVVGHVGNIRRNKFCGSVLQLLPTKQCTILHSAQVLRSMQMLILEKQESCIARQK